MGSSDINEKMDTMKKELVEFSDLKTLKSTAEKKRDELSKETAAVRADVEGSKTKGLEIKKQYESLKAQLASDETAKTLDELEQKMKMLEERVYVEICSKTG